MKMTIDEARTQLIMQKSCALGRDYKALEIALDTMRKYQKLKADYETRLKADMMAMLTDTQLEIKELWDSRYDVWLDNQYYIGKSDTLEEVDDIIQQKIDALKEVVEDGNSD